MSHILVPIIEPNILSNDANRINKNNEINRLIDRIEEHDATGEISQTNMDDVQHNEEGEVNDNITNALQDKIDQVGGLDYTETFAPDAKLTTICTLLVISTVKCWTLHQLDVYNTSIHGDLVEEVYMKPPLRYLSIDGYWVCRL